MFFKKNGLFGKECTRISQTINLDSSIINNSIEFLGERSFNVDCKINIDAERPQRVNFEFTGALLTVPPIGLPLPPVGKVRYNSSHPSSSSNSSSSAYTFSSSCSSPYSFSSTSPPACSCSSIVVAHVNHDIDKWFHVI